MKKIATTLALMGGVLLVPASAQNGQSPSTLAQKKAAQPVTTATVPSGSFFGGGGDDCASSELIVGSGTFNFNTGTTGAEGQVDPLCYVFGTSGIENDVWFKWIPGCLGTVTVETCAGTTTDTKMAAYTFQNGGCPADGTALACNDDTCGLQSSISWAVSGSETYSIQIGTFPGATNGGGGTFTVTCSNPQDVFPYCFGQSDCPCGNTGNTGCENSTGTGANLGPTGTTSISADDITMTIANAPANQSCVVFSASNIYRQTLGDGLRCAGDNAIRLAIGTTDGTGVYTAGPGLIALEDNPQAGDVRRYQGWYRDPAGPCGNGSNLTGAWSVTYTP